MVWNELVIVGPNPGNVTQTGLLTAVTSPVLLIVASDERFLLMKYLR